MCFFRPDPRTATTLLFVVNGSLFASWVPRIPDVKAELGLTDPVLGLALTGMAVGALAVSPVAGQLVSRVGSRGVGAVASVAACLLLPLLGLAGTAPVLFGVLLLVGLADGLCDVGMNAHSIAVQARYTRPILTSFHAWWSIGAVLAAAAGSLAAGAQVSVARHLAATSAVLLLTVLLAWPRLLPATADRTEPGASHGARPTRALLLLGLIALLAAVVEDVPPSWSGIYLREQLGVPPGGSGAAFICFASAMVLGRLFGDRVLARFGPVRVTRAGGLLIAVGMGVALAGTAVPVALVGFTLAGLGVCTMFPVAFGAASAVPGLPSGAGVAAVSLVARAGFLAGPAVTGWLSGLVGLRGAFLLVVAAGLAIAALAGATRPGAP